jgi:hypothetical protein
VLKGMKGLKGCFILVNMAGRLKDWLLSKMIGKVDTMIVCWRKLTFVGAAFSALSLGS